MSLVSIAGVLSLGGGGEGGAPAPLPVSGTLLWLAPGFGGYTDAGSTFVSSEGDHFYQWNDFSGNGYNAVQTADGAGSSPPYRPRYSSSHLNRGKRTVLFSKHFTGGDTSSWFNLPNALGTALAALSEAEMFVVFQKETANNAESNGSWNIGAAADSALCVIGDIFEGFGTTVRKDYIDPVIDLSAAFNVYDVWSKAGDYGILLNNSSIFSTGTNTVGFNSTGVQFGHSGIGGSGFYVSEVVIFPSKLGSTDRSTMYTYFTT